MDQPPPGSATVPTLTTNQALDLIVPFFLREWSSTPPEAIYIRRITGGFVNTLHLVSRTTTSEREPSDVLIRHFPPRRDSSPESSRPATHSDDTSDSATLSPAEQALIYHAMGTRGWGPQVYGLIPNGRLEEWIPNSHTLTPAEAMQPHIRESIARGYARLHSLRLPFRRDGLVRLVADWRPKLLPQGLEGILKSLRRSDSGERFANVLAEGRWDMELEWVTALFARYDCREAISIGDANFLNVLVRSGTQGEEAMLIDYETAMWSYRGIDIGGHFNERMYAWAEPQSTLTGYALPSAEEREAFCQAYLGEARILGTSATDSVERLVAEAEIGQMYQLLFSVMMGVVHDAVPEDGPQMDGLAHMLETYNQLKAEFVRAHDV